MQMNFWKCPHSEYDETADGDRFYMCRHKETEDGICDLQNKYCGGTDNCELLDDENTDA